VEAGTLDVRICEGGEAIHVALAGEIDLASAPRLDAALQEIPRARKIRIDLTSVTFFDASALAVFVRADRHGEAESGRVELVGVGPLARKLLAITGLDSLITDTSGTTRALKDPTK
jgi:anti-anti-sigma factor